MVQQGLTQPVAAGAAAAGTSAAAGASGALGAPDLLSVADAAKLLGVSDADVQAVLDSGELAGKKIGTTWRIKRSAIDAYLAK
jgi:excisionase family DNA binding protein